MGGVGAVLHCIEDFTGIGKDRFSVHGFPGNQVVPGYHPFSSCTINN